ncbi:hypothetical protein HED60_16110 [Planctomycetales bacterium ZRK34]|nr:hypothetical protein HED60_16110 [Planctomycetales bacterium ZRK34]
MVNQSGRDYAWSGAGKSATSCTVADLEGVETITAQHVGEAIQYRLLDRKF